jgi:hypothetical protein
MLTILQLCLGQWSPIALPALALLRNLYLRVADAIHKELVRIEREDNASVTEENHSDSEGGHSRGMRNVARTFIAIDRRMHEMSRSPSLDLRESRVNYPAVPGEEYRNPKISDIIPTYAGAGGVGSGVFRSRDTLEVPSIFRSNVRASSERVGRNSGANSRSGASIRSTSTSISRRVDQIATQGQTQAPMEAEEGSQVPTIVVEAPSGIDNPESEPPAPVPNPASDITGTS